MSLQRFTWLSQSLIGRMTVLSVIFLDARRGLVCTVVPYWIYATEEPLHPVTQLPTY